MSKYEAVYFVGDNQTINQVRFDSSKLKNQGAFSGSLAALVITTKNLVVGDQFMQMYSLTSIPLNQLKTITVL